jgi:hypothetical protein
MSNNSSKKGGYYMARKTKGIGSAATQFKRKDVLLFDARFYQHADMSAQIPNAVGEYRRLRNIAMNRIRKLEKAGYGETETVKKALETFSVLPKKLSHLQAAALLPDAARFIVSKRGTVGGMREIERKTAQTFQDRGFDFVNSKNIRQFTQFLDALGAQKLETLYYKEVSGAPKEGGRARKVASISNIEKAFESWQNANNTSK